MGHFHYTESGLDNVWLTNGFDTETFGEYGSAVAVRQEKDLWRVLALGIVSQDTRMTGQELRFLRTLLDWTQTNLGRHLGYGDGQTVAKWEKARHDAVPVIADTFVRTAYRESIGEPAMVVKTSGRLLELSTTPAASYQRVLEVSPSGEWRQTAAPVEMAFT